MGGGGWSRWAGREEASVTDSKRGKEQRAARSLAGAADWVFKCVICNIKQNLSEALPGILKRTQGNIVSCQCVSSCINSERKECFL
ncbi:hypothetical protein ATANTOWER_008839 [Ataeniobius toweri]|uniref:Uncharacterized protein n=1 Tax=Ataeniobius toweri TaxID=208326 RepID=A0ABU7AG75_9TELE|nr:hypothetical protein [Ataeniobius toweri]